MRRSLLPVILVPLLGCATLHHAQVDEIDASHGHLTPFTLTADEIGINTENTGRAASAVSRSEKPSQVAAIVALFQFGPKTGNPVLNDDFADGLAEEILSRCPSGRVTGLVSTRETRDYNVASQERVTIRGYCIDN